MPTIIATPYASSATLVRLHPMRRTTIAALLVLALGLGLLAAGCLDGTETTATADTVVGALPAGDDPDRRSARR